MIRSQEIRSKLGHLGRNNNSSCYFLLATSYAARSAAAGSTKTPHVGGRAAAAQHAQPWPWHQSSAPAAGALNKAARAAGSGVSLGSPRSNSSSAAAGSASSAAAVVVA